MAYIDTSVLVAYYCPEPLSEAAQKAVSGRGGPTISSLVEVEFCSALAMKVRTGDLDAATAGQIISLFRQHVDDAQYAFVPIGSREYGLARDWIGRFSIALRAADALHLAAAFNSNLTLATADKELARAATHFRVKHKLLS
jgi:uncharacterized protein